MTESTIVEIDCLTKIFRDFWRRQKVKAVDNLTLEIKEGEIFGLLGPNGSGKSTTIKILLGLLYPTDGTVTIFGQSPRSVKIKNDIGYMPEESYLYNYLTPRETLAFYGQLFGLNKTLIAERSKQLLDMVGLSHAADRQVGEFSKGMARRVGLAQALINDPKLIILDEPTSGLDPIGCRQVKDLMLELAKRGKTIILSSHLLADVEDVCHRIAILYNGSIRASGNMTELLQQQDSLYLTIPNLPTDKLKDLIQVLKEKIGSDPELKHPSMNLEEFFMQVVEEAHTNTSYKSGVAEAGEIAGYLKQY